MLREKVGEEDGRDDGWRVWMLLEACSLPGWVAIVVVRVASSLGLYSRVSFGLVPKLKAGFPGYYWVVG